MLSTSLTSSIRRGGIPSLTDFGLPREQSIVNDLGSISIDSVQCSASKLRALPK